MQRTYQPPPQSSTGFPAQYQQRQSVSPGPRASPAQFTGFKLAGATPPPPAVEQQRRSTGPRRWTVEQLRASDAIIPLQSGTNQFASQRGMTGFGRPRNNTTPVHGGLHDGLETHSYNLPK